MEQIKKGYLIRPEELNDEYDEPAIFRLWLDEGLITEEEKERLLRDYKIK